VVNRGEQDGPIDAQGRQHRHRGLSSRSPRSSTVRFVRTDEP
jgi:hypothetical protein